MATKKTHGKQMHLSDTAHPFRMAKKTPTPKKGSHKALGKTAAGKGGKYATDPNR